MYIKAIVDKLKNGSIKLVQPIGEYNKAVNTGSMLKPYILVYETPKYARGNYSDNGYTFITILVAFPTSYQQDLDKYTYFELFNLLDKCILQVTNGTIITHVKVSVTDRVSQIITDTSDGYIARERVIAIPYRWR
jgi:hypothetical protein